MKPLNVIKQTKAMFMTGLLVTGLLTASMAAAEESPAAGPSTLVASITVNDTKAEFHELFPGELAVLVQHPHEGKGGTNPLAEALQSLNVVEDGEVDPVSLFTFLSQGAEPPEALVKAYDRVQQARESSSSFPKGPEPLEGEREDIPTSSDDSSDIFGSDATINSGTWFRENYCPLTTDYCYCMLYRTGSGSISKYTDHMRSTAYSYRGTISHSLQYYRIGFFQYATQITQHVPQGYVGSIWVTGISYWRRALMGNADGDGFHWSVYGGETLGCLPYPCYCSAN